MLGDADASFFKHVQITELDGTHLFLTGYDYACLSLCLLVGEHDYDDVVACLQRTLRKKASAAFSSKFTYLNFNGICVCVVVCNANRAPKNLQAVLQREVDRLHDRHTYAQTGSDVRDNKFKVSH